MKIHRVMDFLGRWFLGTLLSVAGAFTAYCIGGGGEYPFAQVKNFIISPLHHPGIFFTALGLIGMLVGLGLPRDKNGFHRN